MPSVIPYDPSLALGNLVTEAKLAVLDKIAAIQSKADSAEDKLNNLISLRRSFDMTIQELMDMSVDTTDLVKERDEVNKQIAVAAVDFSKQKLQAERDIQPLKDQIKMVSDSLESPLDYNRTAIKQMPISADSLKMNVQYFAVDRNAQNANTHALSVSTFVSDETEWLGDSISGQMSSAAQAQTSGQLARHKIEGTLVVSVSCTHKNAQLLAPLIIDVDKAIRVWNQLHSDKTIDTSSVKNLAAIAKEANKPEDPHLTILSGATYGSCFVGMVHVLNTTDTESSEEMYSIAEKMQAQFKVGGWFASESGGFGVDSSFSSDAKNLLSTQNITAHCTLVTMGSIPSITSNKVDMGVKGFADDDGAKSMAALMKLQNATMAAQDSVDQSAAAARTGGQFVAIKNSNMTAALSALADIDKIQNNMIDTNSMMLALDDYIKKALEGNLGVPINYYIKPIYRSQLAEMWVAKYFPGRFLAIAGDDSAPSPAPAPGPAPAPSPAPAPAGT